MGQKDLSSPLGNDKNLLYFQKLSIQHGATWYFFSLLREIALFHGQFSDHFKPARAKSKAKWIAKGNWHFSASF